MPVAQFGGPQDHPRLGNSLEGDSELSRAILLVVTDSGSKSIQTELSMAEGPGETTLRGVPSQ